MTIKRWLCWLFLVVGVVFLLENPHRLVSPPSYLYLQAANPSVLHHNGCVSTWCRALPAAHPDRAGPLEFFATEFAFLITELADDEGPPGLDDRGPPGPNACRQLSVTSRKAAGQVGSASNTLPQKFPPFSRPKPTPRFWWSREQAQWL